MALSKCVLDRVSERKNELKGRMYGLVEIMSRSVFARMQKRTSLYKDLLDQLVEQVFNKFTQELNEAWRDGCAHGRDLESSLNQHISNDEEYGLDSEIDDDSLSISTFESQTSSSEQSLDDDADYDGEEYYSIMAPMDGVDQFVLDRVEERKNELKGRMYGLVEIISRSVFARMEKRTCTYKNLLDQLVEQVFAMLTQELNDAWRDGCAHGLDLWNGYLDYGDSSEDQPEMNNLDSIGPFSLQPQQSPQSINIEYDEGEISLHQIIANVSGNGQMESGPSEDNQYVTNDEELAVEGLNGVFNSVLIESLSQQQSLSSIEVHEEYDKEEEYALQSNEDSSLHSSPTQSQPPSQSQHENIIQNYEHVSCSESMTESAPISFTLSRPSSQQSLRECKLYGEVDDDREYCEDICDDEELIETSVSETLDEVEEEGREMMDHDQNEKQSEEHDRDTQITGNNSDLSEMNGEEVEEGCVVGRIMDNHLQGDELSCQNALPLEENLSLVGGQMDNDDEMVVNAIEHRVNLLPIQNMSIFHQPVISINKCSRTAELRPCLFAWGGCTKTFTDDDHLQKHLELIHRNHLGSVHFTQSLMKCPRENCYQTFAQNADLQVHLESHTGQLPHISHGRRHSIPSETNDEDKDEQQQTGHGAQLLMANEGQFVLSVPSSQVGVVSDNNTTASEHVCEHCGKVSRTASGLAAHIRTHTGEKPFKCPWRDCQKAFAQKCNLNYHLKLHNNDFPYVCAHCPKRFRVSAELKVHTRTHTGERPFRCPLDSCNMTFSRIANMKLHHMSHSGQFPHVCDHCAASFRTPDRLKVHIRRHTGERPFQCTWQDCAKRFRSDRYLKQHYRTHGSTRVHSIQSVPRDK